MQQYIRSIIIPWSSGIYPNDAKMVQHLQTDMIYHINKIKLKDDMMLRSAKEANIFLFSNENFNIHL